MSDPRPSLSIPDRLLRHAGARDPRGGPTGERERDRHSGTGAETRAGTEAAPQAIGSRLSGSRNQGASPRGGGPLLRWRAAEQPLPKAAGGVAMITRTSSEERRAAASPRISSARERSCVLERPSSGSGRGAERRPGVTTEPNAPQHLEEPRFRAETRPAPSSPAAQTRRLQEYRARRGTEARRTAPGRCRRTVLRARSGGRRARAQPNQTRPTGFSAEPPSGPAIPGDADGDVRARGLRARPRQAPARSPR